MAEPTLADIKAMSKLAREAGFLSPMVLAYKRGDCYVRYAGNPQDWTPDRRDWLMKHVAEKCGVGLVMDIYFEHPKRIVLTLESGVKRVLPWPARDTINGRFFA